MVHAVVLRVRIVTNVNRNRIRGGQDIGCKHRDLIVALIFSTDRRKFAGLNTVDVDIGVDVYTASQLAFFFFFNVCSNGII